MALEPITASDVGVAALRVATGLFFASSGYHKLFSPENRAALADTLKSAKVYSPAFAVALPSGELLGGLGLITGVLTIPACIGLSLIMVGAIVLVAWKQVLAYKPKDALEFVSDCLYVPEGYLLLTLIILGLVGWDVNPLSGDALFLAVVRGDIPPLTL